VSSVLRILRLLAPRWGLVLASSLALACVSGTTVALAALVGPFLAALHGADASSSGPTTSPVSLAATVVAITVARAVASYAHRQLTAHLGEDVVRRLRERMYGHVIRITRETLSTQRRGAIASHLSSDALRVQGLVTHDLTAVTGDVLTLVGLTVLAFRLDPTLATLGLAALPLAVALTIAVARRIRATQREASEQQAQVASLAAEAVDASPVLRAYGAEEQAQSVFARESRRLEESSRRAHRWAALGGPLVQVVGALGLLAALLLGARQLAAGELAPETFVSLFAAVLLVLRPVQSVGGRAHRFASGLAAFDRVEALLELPLEPADPPGAIEVPRLQRDVRLEGVRHSYPGGAPVLRGVDLLLRKGEALAIVGASGSGKTTLLRVLMGLLRAEGSLSIDDLPVERATTASWRRQFAWVPQDPVILADTVLANVALADAAPDRDRARRALDAAGASEPLDALGGLDASLAEAGRTLSGGQRQRIAIARALYRESPVLLFDEATSSLDGASEQAIAETIEQLMADRTVVVVSHRLQTVARADRVVVLENGQIVEDGPPSRLLTHSSRFRALFASGEEPEERSGAEPSNVG
jgi:ABC-type multidrug transport system fused ATPase/permease subunit